MLYKKNSYLPCNKFKYYTIIQIAVNLLTGSVLNLLLIKVNEVQYIKYNNICVLSVVN